MTAQREGPLVRRVCTGCRWLRGERYSVQGDSGCDYYCTHPSVAPGAGHVGDSSTDTPVWCPVLREGGSNG